MSRLRGGLVLALGVAIAGCGTQKLDVAEAERTISKRLSAQAKATVKVQCPDDVKIKKGDKFDCRASTSKDKATVKVTQLDDEGRVRWEVSPR